METVQPSLNLFMPKNGQLFQCYPLPEDSKIQKKSKQISNEIKSLVSQKDYPCIAAMRSYTKDDYQVGMYGSFGTGQSWRTLRNDLLFFLKEQKKTSSIYLSFWAVFEPQEMSEEEFEQALWNELSHLTSEEDKAFDWPQGAITDPQNPGFRFSLGGSEFFVVGLHSNSSRKARKFSRPTLIFNIFDQFDQLAKQGVYESMVNVNRKKDEKFQGNVNPMVAQHGEQWESIQFSGKENPNAWKCPFHFLFKSAKV